MAPCAGLGRHSLEILMVGSVLLKHSLFALLVTGQPKGDGKISEIVEKWKCCSDIAEGEVETL